MVKESCFSTAVFSSMEITVDFYTFLLLDSLTETVLKKVYTLDVTHVLSLNAPPHVKNVLKSHMSFFFFSPLLFPLPFSSKLNISH